MKYLSILILSFFIPSWNFNLKQSNFESDKKAGEEVVNLFFTEIEELDHTNASKFFGKKFFDVTTKSTLFQIFQTTDKKLGPLKSKKVSKWNANSSIGTSSSTTYVYYYKCYFEKDSATIKITLMKEAPSDSIKIIGYYVASNAFLE